MSGLKVKNIVEDCLCQQDKTSDSYAACINDCCNEEDRSVNVIKYKRKVQP